MEYFKFLKSSRFHAAVVIGASILAFHYGLVPEAFLDFVWTVCGTHIGIRTLDRATEKIGNGLAKKK